MTQILLPYVYDFPKLADYMKAVKPLRQFWDILHRDAEWKSPADEWKWCWAQDYAEECQ
jgi:hypothetical protein